MPWPANAIVVACPPGARGARETLAGLSSRSVRLMFTGAGLAWLEDAASLAQLLRVSHDLALCSQSARERGLDASRTPAGVRWSGLGVWMAEQRGGAFAWWAP